MSHLEDGFQIGTGFEAFPFTSSLLSAGALPSSQLQRRVLGFSRRGEETPLVLSLLQGGDQPFVVLAAASRAWEVAPWAVCVVPRREMCPLQELAATRLRGGRGMSPRFGQALGRGWRCCTWDGWEGAFSTKLCCVSSVKRAGLKKCSSK